MAEINLIKNLKPLISVRVSIEAVPTNEKFKFNSKNNDSKSNYSNSSDNNDNNEQKYNYNNDNDNDHKNNSKNNHKIFFDNNNND